MSKIRIGWTIDLITLLLRSSIEENNKIRFAVGQRDENAADYHMDSDCDDKLVNSPR